VALNRLADKVALNGRRPSTQEIEESLRDNHGIVKIDGVEYAFGGVESLLGAASTPEEALMALYHGGLSSGAVANELELLLLDDGHDLDIVNQPTC
jgi:hypothetical protein